MRVLTLIMWVMYIFRVRVRVRGRGRGSSCISFVLILTIIT